MVYYGILYLSANLGVLGCKEANNVFLYAYARCGHVLNDKNKQIKV